jgi:hypothetical protein
MATVKWKIPVSGSWTDAGDWSNGEVPRAGADAVIDAGGVYTVSVQSASVVARSVTVRGSGARLAVDARGGGSNVAVTASSTMPAISRSAGSASPRRRK